MNWRPAGVDCEDQLLISVPELFRRYARSGGVLFQTAP